MAWELTLPFFGKDIERDTLDCPEWESAHRELRAFGSVERSWGRDRSWNANSGGDRLRFRTKCFLVVEAATIVARHQKRGRWSPPERTRIYL